jgi:hypothetical protein
MKFFEITLIASFVAVVITLLVAIVTLFKKGKQRKSAMVVYRRVALFCTIVVSIAPVTWLTELIVAYKGSHLFEMSALTNRVTQFANYFIAIGIPALFWVPALRKFPLIFILLLSLWLVFHWPK